LPARGTGWAVRLGGEASGREGNGVAAGQVAAKARAGLTWPSSRSRVSHPEKDKHGVSLLILSDPRADRLCSRQSLNVIRGALTLILSVQSRSGSTGLTT